MTQELTYRVGADIGGTFTDIVMMSSSGQILKRKQSSTPDDYSQGIVEGLDDLLRAEGVSANKIVELVHATTVATNTVLEGKGARTALITTKGFRDVLEIGRVRVPRLYDLNYEKPKPLARRRHRYEVTERILSDGSILTPLDKGAIAAIANDILSEGIEAVAICLLNSYANPVHEEMIRDALEKLLPREIFVTCSCDVLPEIREYERTSTTVVNAYLGPIVRNYLDALSGRLRGIGVACPIRIMNSAGGLMSIEAASKKPAYIIESGPAAGVIAGAYMAKLAGYPDVITVDMGGTTAKAALIEASEPARTTEYEVGAGINVSSKLVKGGGHSVKLPFIDVSEIGAGGGSLVGFDSGGLLTVGPESAGSVPGPVCYDRGNDTPTLTDAFITLGYLNPEAIAGGAVKLNASRAKEALNERVALPMGLSTESAGLGVQAIATATMSRAVKAVSTYCGRDPRDFALFAFGGNGPMIANEIARTMGIKTVIIPPSPGVFSAMGLLFSAIEHEFTATDFRLLAPQVGDSFLRGFEELQARAVDAMKAEGYLEETLENEWFADLRYQGQAFELTTPVASGSDGQALLAAALNSFHAEHKRTYGHANPDNPVELVSYRVKVRVTRDQSDDIEHWSVAPSNQEISYRHAVFSDETTQEVPVIPRGHLVAQAKQGPFIVEEYDSTFVVPPGATAQVDNFGNIVVTLESGK